MSRILIIGPGSGLAKAIGSEMSRRGHKIFGCVRNPQVLGEKKNSQQISFEVILGDDFEIKFDLVINCANFRDWSDPKKADYFTNMIPGLVMEKLSRSGSRVINFGTYLQFYDIPKVASLYQYAQAKRHLSEKVQSLPNSTEFVLYTIYGVGDHSNSMINYLLRSIKEGTPVDFSPGNQLIALTRIQDVASHIATFCHEEVSNNFTHYSLWPTPPISIREVVSIVEREVGLIANIQWGARMYAGHETFDYDSNVFPKQYIATDWTDLALGLTETYANILGEK